MKDAKTIRVPEEVHEKLTAMLGELMAQKKKLQSYADVISYILERAVILPDALLEEVDRFIKRHPHLGFTTREEFIRDAIRHRIRELTDEFEEIEIPREDYERLQEAIRETHMPFLTPADLIHHQIREVLQKYEEWKRMNKKAME